MAARSSPKIRIFVDAHVFDGEHQGSLVYLRGLYRAVSETASDVETTLAASNVARLEQEFAGCSRVHFERLRSRSATARLGWEIPRLVANGAYQYAHFQYIQPPICRARTIVTMHDALVLSNPGLFSRRFVARSAPLFVASAHLADVLLTVSEFSRDEIARRMLVARERIGLVPNGVGAQYFDRARSLRCAEACRERLQLGRYIVYVSRMEKRKNQHGLVRAWLHAGLPARGVRLVLVGSTRQMYSQLRQELERLPAEAAALVDILEGLDDDMLQGLVSGSIGFVYPSLAEGFGIPPLEAAAMQVPTVCSNRTAMRDYRFFGDAQFDPENFGEFVHALERMVETPPSEQVLVQRAQYVFDNYSWASVSGRFLDIITRDCRAMRR